MRPMIFSKEPLVFEGEVYPKVDSSRKLFDKAVQVLPIKINYLNKLTNFPIASSSV